MNVDGTDVFSGQTALQGVRMEPIEVSEEDLKKKLKRYNARYNNIAKKVLDFKSPNQIVEEYKLNFLSA